MMMLDYSVKLNSDSCAQYNKFSLHFNQVCQFQDLGVVHAGLLGHVKVCYCCKKKSLRSLWIHKESTYADQGGGAFSEQVPKLKLGRRALGVC